MPLGLGLGLGIGSGAIYPPASSWPSVSDIPPGMVVLDAGGVVKIKVANELLTMEEFAIMLVKNGEAVTYNGQAILVDELNQIIYGDLL